MLGIQDSERRRRLSRLRRSLRRCVDEIGELILVFMSRRPVIKGSVYELKRKCGKPRCKCTRGQLHKRMVLSFSEQGKTKLRVIPGANLAEVSAMVGDYQGLRQARARLVRLHRKMLAQIDEIEALRRQEMAPQDVHSGDRQL